ncbi:hypothetical protein ELQ90_14650 [Labedella phragmitis]|uniref:IPT/TIG domain-containing protein n=1 Tax=Labedella phragmitis TaxID=2498849 RepID=A0A444PPD7_9MICO|nr:IPT/TIG domain-containing protein [Labedella phragmitis]RWZ46294.1 hypothetical protein ELQ90_14650 [Labedella phragmitis]
MVSTIFASAGAGAASAAPGDRAQAEALFLSGDGLIDLDTIAELAGPFSQFTPGSAENAPLDVSALGLIELGLGLQLFGGNDVLDLGATGQYTATSADGAVAASGLITGTGAIAVGNGSPEQRTSLDLGPVLDDVAADGVVDALALELDALTARAASERGATGATTDGDYQVAGGRLRISAPALTRVVTGLQDTVAGTEAAVDGLAADGGPIDSTVDGLLGGIAAILDDALVGLVSLDAPAVTATLDVDLSSVVADAIADDFVSGPVTIDLGAGEILVDLDELYTLNELAPNTRLLDDPVVNAQITEAISDILTDQLPTAVVGAVSDVLDETTLTIDIAAAVEALGLPLGDLAITIVGSVGGFLGSEGESAPVVDLDGTEILGLDLGVILAPITDYVTASIVPAVGGVLAGALDLQGLETAVTATGTGAVTALTPLVDLLGEIVRITINVQERPGSFRHPAGADATSFTQTAVRVEVLPGAADVVTLDLASATVTAAPLAAPTVGSVAPDRGPETGGTEVTITGTGFDELSGPEAVLFGDTPAASYVVVSDTEITAVTPPNAPATVPVTVTNPDGASTPGEFTFFPLTDITGVDPGTGSEEGGDAVTITGSCFTGATDVLFGGTPAAEFQVVSDTEIVATTAAGTGTVDVTVVNPTECGDATLEDAFVFVPEGAAVVTGLEPDRGPEVGGTLVTITGSGFAEATGVLVDGEPATDVEIVSDTEIELTTPAHAPGTVDVQVVTDVGASAPADFTYYGVTTVDTVDPDAGPIAGGTTVVITGSCFTGATGVLFGDVPATSFVVDSDTRITAVVPAGAVPGAVDVTVIGAGECADGGEDGPGTLPDGFEYVGVPVVTDLDPARGPVTGGTEVTITGSGLATTTAVSFGGVPATDIRVVSDEEIVATSPASEVTGPVEVLVTTAGGSVDAGDFDYFDVGRATAIDPDRGPETGGTEVTITGEGLADTTGVSFGGVPAESFEVVDDSTVVAVTPAHRPEVVDVVLTNDAGESEPVGFEFYDVAAIDDVEPGIGPAAGGTTVTITGSCFTGATAVFFGGVEASSFVVVSDTEIRAVTPAGASGVVDVTVLGAGECGEATAPDGFQYTDAPIVTSVAPDRGPVDGGTLVTITGEGLSDTTAVTFDGVEGTRLTVVSATEVTVFSPPHPAGTVDLVVVDPDGASVPVSFTYVGADAPIPGGTGVGVVTPPSGPAGGGTTVTITGTCFTGAQAVYFGDSPAAGFTVVSDTEIRAVSPAGSGSVDVTVIGSADCGSGTLSDAFTYQTALAVTGAGGSGLVLLALLLFLAGAAGVWFSTRRVALR